MTRRQSLLMMAGSAVPALSCADPHPEPEAQRLPVGLAGYQLVYVEPESELRFIDDSGQVHTRILPHFGVNGGLHLVALTGDGGAAVIYRSTPFADLLSRRASPSLRRVLIRQCIEVVDLVTGTFARVDSPGSEVRDCRMSRDRRRIAVLVDCENTVANNRPALFFREPGAGPWQRLDSYSDRERTPSTISMSGDGKYVVCSLGDRCVAYDTNSGQKTEICAGTEGSICPFDDRVAVQNQRGRLEITSLSGRTKRHELEVALVDGIEWAPDGRHAVAAQRNLTMFLGLIGDGLLAENDISLVDMETGAIRRLARQPAMMPTSTLRWMVSGDSPVDALMSYGRQAWGEPTERN